MNESKSIPHPSVSDTATLVSGTLVLPFVYTWNPNTRGYDQVDTLEFGAGYWFAATEDTQLTVEYEPRSTLTSRQLKGGWNMVGSVSGNVLVGDLISVPDGTVLPFVYRWDSATRGYEMVQEIEPGVGHWIAAISDATLTIDSTSASTAPAALALAKKPSWESVIAIQTQSISSNIGTRHAVSVQDQRQELVFGMHSSASGGFDKLLDRPLPPFPAWVNDNLKAAWTIEDPSFSLLDKSYVGDSSHASWELSIELPEPGELQWRQLPTAYRCLLQYDGQVIQMQDDVGTRHAVSLPLPAGRHTLRLVLDAFDALPKQTQLLSNYPNPSNPETWIPYRLSEDSDVTLVIYDISGKEVRRFHLYQQLAGEYQNKQHAIYWDGRNQAGETVGSGVYFYSLQTAGISQTRKLVIIR